MDSSYIGIQYISTDVYNIPYFYSIIIYSNNNFDNNPEPESILIALHASYRPGDICTRTRFLKMHKILLKNKITYNYM